MNSEGTQEHRQRTKRSRSKKVKLLGESTSESQNKTLCLLESPENKSICSASKRPRKRRKKTKKPSISDKGTGNKLQTNSNYPKELSARNSVSCNWKRLSQMLSANKSVKGAGVENQVVKPKKNSTLQTTCRPHPKSSSLKDEIWFDGVDKELLEPSTVSGLSRRSKKENTLVKEGSFAGLTSAVAMDCEMVGTGENGAHSVLARVSIVNLMGNCIYDKYVKCDDTITDYRTAVSGIRPSDLEKGEDFKKVQKEVSDILDKRILVGHAVHNDLKVLFLTHPRRKIRDTSMYKSFRSVSKGNTPSLKRLAQTLLGVKVQEGEHNSIQDAQAAMRLYTMHKIDWENSIRKKKLKRMNGAQKTSVKKLPNSPTTRKLAQLKI